MNRGNKRILIIGFFVLVWLVLVFYGYKKFKTQNVLTYDFEQQDLIQVQKTNNNIQENDGFEKPIRIHNPEIDDDVLAYISQDKIENKNQYLNNQEQGFFDDIVLDKCGEFPCYTAKQFLDMYNSFEIYSGLNYIDKTIYDGGVADDYLRHIAENRGYKNRVFADEEDIVNYAGIMTRTNVRNSYISMRDEMKKEGILLHFVSGYRSARSQVSIFKRKMGNIVVSGIINGDYDEKITEVLNRSALPGYSKHHSGYAVDFGCGNDYLVYDFASTNCYDWMSKNNFENAKRFGFIPSYPNGTMSQGPDPEPWEYVWVGNDYIKSYLKQK